MAVMSANPSGLVLPIAKTGPVCDVNSSTDTTDLLDDSLGDDYWDLPGDEMFDVPLGDPGMPDLPGLPDAPDMPGLPDAPGLPDPPDPPMPPDPPGPPMPPDPPGPDGLPLGQPGQPGPGGNEGQPNPDKKPPTTPPPGQPTSPTSTGQEWFPTPFNWENGSIYVKWTTTLSFSATTYLNTVYNTVTAGETSPGRIVLTSTNEWSGSGIGFRTTPAGTVAVMNYLGDYSTPFVHFDLFGFYVLRQQERTTPSGTNYVETQEINIGAAGEYDIGDKRGWNPTIFGTVFFTSSVIWSIEIIEFTFNGVPQNPPVFNQYTTMPTY
jgi:hypothetical protein